MPPRPQLNAIRDAIAEKPKPFLKVLAGLKRFGGLDREAGVLKRMPRGFDENHSAAEWLRFQSFTAGRLISDAQATGPGLPALLQ